MGLAAAAAGYGYAFGVGVGVLAVLGSTFGGVFAFDGAVEVGVLNLGCVLATVFGSSFLAFWGTGSLAARGLDVDAGAGGLAFAAGELAFAGAAGAAAGVGCGVAGVFTTDPDLASVAVFTAG